MNIIITGLEMPTERESFNLTIKYNGTVLDTETGTQVAEAHELPPHGRWNKIIHGIIPSGQCSNCGAWDKVTRFCPNCGSQMEGET